MWIEFGRQANSFDFPDLEAVVSRYRQIVEPFSLEYDRWLNLDTGAQVLLVGFASEDREKRFEPFTALLHRSPAGTWTNLNRLIWLGVGQYERRGFIPETFYTAAQYARPRIADMLALDSSPETTHPS